MAYIYFRTINEIQIAFKLAELIRDLGLDVSMTVERGFEKHTVNLLHPNNDKTRGLQEKT